MSVDLQWFDEQVKAYTRVKRRYDAYSAVLGDILRHVAKGICPNAMIDFRAKKVTSFAGKIMRRYDVYRGIDAVEKMTDLAGARVIVHLDSEVQAVSGFIRDNFAIDEKNSQDTSVRLGTDRFGYRSVHFIVALKRGKTTYPNALVKTPSKLYGLKGEIQVRTIAQHAWADIAHDRIYKSPFAVPDALSRESARAAALLESADATFARMAEGIENLRSNTTVSVEDEKETQVMIERLRAVLRVAGQDAALVEEIARLHIALEEWDKAITVVAGFNGPCTARLLTCKGYAMCQKGRANRHGRDYRRGQRVLEEAVAADIRDTEPLSRLAESWIGVDKRRALACFRSAFEINPTEPGVLSGYLRYQIHEAGSLRLVPLVRPNMEQAIAKSRTQAQVKVNLPWAHYAISELELLLGRPFESLASLANAIVTSPEDSTIDQAINEIQLIEGLADELPEIEWVRRFLLLAKAVRSPGRKLPPSLARLAHRQKIKSPVVIMAGGCDPMIPMNHGRYAKLLKQAFADYRGTIISGGTREGISGIIGAIAQASRGPIHAIGYLPAQPPRDGSATLDRRFTIRRTTGRGRFTPLEPLQNWIDILASGIDPADVKLLGINGGNIAAFEYRLAAVLGAKVGIVRHSGREADKISPEPRDRFPGIHLLPEDPLTLSAFIEHGRPGSLTEEEREHLAEIIHDHHRLEKLKPAPHEAESTRVWGELNTGFKKSNYQQAEDIAHKLAVLGLTARPATRGMSPAKFTFNTGQVERLAQMEHGRWNVERTLAGWTYAQKKDETNLRSPYLVPWTELDDKTRDYDRDAVRNIPGLLAAIGSEIVPLTGQRKGRKTK